MYRSKQEFLASLPPWRRLLQTLNWHPTIDKRVQQYELEQRILQEEKVIEQLKKENARLAELNSKLDLIMSTLPPIRPQRSQCPASPRFDLPAAAARQAIRSGSINRDQKSSGHPPVSGWGAAPQGV
jgi:hypothetical protein